MMKTKRLLLACIASLAFVSCGGGNGGDDDILDLDPEYWESQVDEICSDPENSYVCD